MADTDEGEIVHPADPPQQLVDFVGAFQDPQAQEAFGDAAVRVQDYMMRRDIAADNAAAADRLVSNLGQFKDGLARMVYADPAAVDLGLDLVPDIVHGIAHTHPYLPDDQRDSAYDNITTDIQREIARTGVMSLADRNADAARALLGSDRVAALIDGQDRLGLEGYIGAMDSARTTDAAAVAQQRAVDQQRDTGFAMANYLGALVDPNTQEMQFPDGWAQRITADPTVPPAATAALLGVYSRLQTGGDVKHSDPFLMANVIQRLASDNPPSTWEILNEAGNGLRVADAVSMARHSVGSMTPAMRREFGEVSTTIDAARRFIASPENGPAGHVAFGRFMDWLTANYSGMGSLNPKSDNYILPTEGTHGNMVGSFWNNFMPNNEDIVLGSRLNGNPRSINQLRSDTGDRMPLDQILGPRRGTNADTVIHAPRVFNPMRTPYRRGNPEIKS
jgi:hypothetical protein